MPPPITPDLLGRALSKAALPGRALLIPLLSTALFCAVLFCAGLGAGLLSGGRTSSGTSAATVEAAARAEQTGVARAAFGDPGRERAEPAANPAPSGPDQPPPVVDRLAWPLAGPPQLVRPFEPPSHEYGPGHRGADLAGDREQPVLSAGDGIVVHSGRVTDRELVSVEHPGGLRTTYEPVSPTVAAGQHVATGQPLGTLQAGHPGCRTAPLHTCLHWGARQLDRYLDPTKLIGGRLRLLPWDGAPRTPAPETRASSG